MIPLISSRCRGLLGVSQLPRTWWKALLHGAGLLDAAYPPCSRELDSWCLDVLEIDRKDAMDHLRTAMPTYLEFEAWILERRGGRFNQARIARWNNAVERRVHANPAKIAETYGDIGWDTDAETEVSALLLNCLQDWALFYRTREAMPFTMPPLISSLDTGPLGVLQLPRTWLKVLLRGQGMLHSDYPDCGGGLDAGVFEVLGVDPDRALRFLREETPSYLRFEAWVREQTNNRFDRDRIATWHRFLVDRVHPEGKRTAIHSTIGRPDDGSVVHGVILNHLEDWALAHKALLDHIQ